MNKWLQEIINNNNYYFANDKKNAKKIINYIQQLKLKNKKLKEEKRKLIEMLKDDKSFLENIKWHLIDDLKRELKEKYFF